MDKDTSTAPQGDDHEPDNEYLCPACEAHYKQDRFALECEVCAAADRTVGVEF